MSPIATPQAKPWLLHLVCCGRDDGTWPCATWDEADAIRESYVTAEGHERSAVITHNDVPPTQRDN